MASPLSSMMHESLVKNMFNCDISYLGKCEFKNRKNREQNLSTKVYSIRLNRLLQRNDSNRCKIKCLKKIFKLTRISDLTHTISALYDTSLPDIGPVSVYDCICSPKAFTICILKDTEPHKPTELTDEVNEDTNTGYSSEDCLSSIEDGVKQPEPLFQHLFSEDPTDLNTGESEDEDEDTDPDHTAGLKTYIKANRGNPGVEKARILKSLIACATLERVSTFQLPGHDEWVIDLQLMSVREKYRGFNIGKYLINSIQNRNLVGTYDAIVTCSDSSAIQFYEKYAFCIDPILNSKYSHIGDIWTNTTKMCFIPPYCSLMDNEQTKQVIKEIESEQDLDLNEDLGSGVKEVKESFIEDVDHSSFIAELTNMERDVKRWQKLMFSSYQSQAKLFYKMKQEVLTLKAKLCAKDSLIDDLKVQNELLIKNNKLLKMKLSDYQDFDIELNNVQRQFENAQI